MRIIGAILGAIIGIAVLEVLFSTFFMMIGAKLAKIKNVTFLTSFIAAIGCSIATWIITIVFSILPFVGTILGFLAGIAVSLFIIKSVFNTNIENALLIWIFNIAAKIVAIIIAVLTFASIILSLFHL